MELDGVAEADLRLDARADMAVLRQRVARGVHPDELAAVAEGRRGAICPAETVRCRIFGLAIDDAPPSAGDGEDLRRSVRGEQQRDEDECACATLRSDSHVWRLRNPQPQGRGQSRLPRPL